MPTVTSPFPAGRLEQGARFAGRYLVQSALGEGGMGSVYLVLDELLNERVALKIAAHGVRDEGLAQRREVSLARRVTHPHVARVFDLGVHDGVLYITMEHVPGTSLRKRLRAGALPVHEVVTLGAQIASALAAAHDAGVVHLDLKPDNVIVVDGAVPRAVLVDFGISRTLGERGTGAGTRHYMAPEQLGNEALGGAVDVYALGLLLHELATGTRAFDVERDGLLRRLVSKPPLLVDVPPTLASLIDTCLSIRAADRPEMRVVERALAREGGASPSTTTLSPSSPSSTDLPTDVGLRLARARAALAVGGDELRVLPELEAIVAAHPTLDIAIATHALALVRAWNNALASDDIADRAVAAVSQAIALAPHLADTHLADALVADAAGDFAYAVRALRRALARDPLHAFSHEILGFLEVEAGVADTKRLELAHALDPTHRASIVEVARELIFAGKDDQALALLDELDAAGVTHESRLLRMRHALWHRDRARAQALIAAIADDDSPIAASVRVVCRAIVGDVDVDAVRALLDTLLSLPTTPKRRAFLHLVFVEVLADVDVEAACEHLLECARLPLADLRWLDACPALAPLRATPAFAVARATLVSRRDAAFGVVDGARVVAVDEATTVDVRTVAG
jgi:tetratricopeptide (TPR) repeat protein